MEPIYRISFPVTTNDVDRFCRLKPSSLLNMLQDAAGAQCNEISLSWEELAAKGLFWAIIRQHVQITRLPGPGTTVTVETWPGITSRVAYPRSSIGYDQDGNELFRAISLWVLLDMKTRAMVLPGKSGIEITGLERGCELPVPAAVGVARLAGGCSRTVTFSELDRNGHMSNTRYLDWMADLLPSSYHRGHRLADFNISYLSEAVEGEEVTLGYELTGEGDLRLEAASREGRRVFALKAKYTE